MPKERGKWIRDGRLGRGGAKVSVREKMYVERWGQQRGLPGGPGKEGRLGPFAFFRVTLSHTPFPTLGRNQNTRSQFSSGKV